MAELQNIFSWSVSTRDNFNECRRRRFWAKYAMWNGWQASASELQRTAYRLSKMENRFTILGNAVERAVMWMLADARAGHRHTIEEAYTEIVRPYLNKCWSESRQRMWQGNPKQYCCLHEHYYPEHHQTPEAQMTSRMIGAIKNCIGNFEQLLLPNLIKINPADEISISTVGTGDPESFMLDDVKVYAIPDYVCRNGEMLNIHDWKSGAPRPKHKDQMAVYGLWAVRKHNWPAEKITVQLEYLAAGKTIKAVLTAADMDATVRMIGETTAEMAEYLKEGDMRRNIPLPKEYWEMAADMNICRRCNFYELCKPELE